MNGLEVPRNRKKMAIRERWPFNGNGQNLGRTALLGGYKSGNQGQGNMDL